MTLSFAPELKIETWVCDSFSISSAAEPCVSSERCTCSENNPRAASNPAGLPVTPAQGRFCPPRPAGRSFGFNPSTWHAFGCRIKVHSSQMCSSSPQSASAPAHQSAASSPQSCSCPCTFWPLMVFLQAVARENPLAVDLL